MMAPMYTRSDLKYDSKLRRILEEASARTGISFSVDIQRYRQSDGFRINLRWRIGALGDVLSNRLPEDAYGVHEWVRGAVEWVSDQIAEIRAHEGWDGP